jgi:hypothetical protein
MVGRAWKCGCPRRARCHYGTRLARCSVLWASRTISRFLYPLLAQRAATIRLGRRLLRGSSDLPGSRNGAGRSSSPIWSCSAWGLPCRRALPQPRCALTAPFHPYQLPCGNRRYIFCGTFRKTRFERVPPAVSRHAALWRPDFPPLLIVKMRQGRLPVREAHFIIELVPA